MESSLHTNVLHINNAAHYNDLLCFNEIYGKSALHTIALHINNAVNHNDLLHSNGFYGKSTSHTSVSLHSIISLMIMKTALSSPLSVKITHKTPVSSLLSVKIHHLMG